MYFYTYIFKIVPRSGIARSNMVTAFKSLETHCPVERMVLFTPLLAAAWCVYTWAWGEGVLTLRTMNLVQQFFFLVGVYSFNKC